MFGNALRLPFRIFGIPILLHWTLLLILPFLAWSIGRNAAVFAGFLGLEPGLLASGSMPYILGLAAAIGLFLSVLLHELGHAITARAYGVSTRSISLWLLGGVAQFERMPLQRGAEAVVAIAGPLTSLALAVGFAVAQAFTPATMPAILFVFFYLKVTNFILAVFNMLPAFPLDGGRVLRSLLALKLGQVRATRIAGGVGTFLAIALGIWGLMTGQMITVLVAVFIYMAGSAETRQTIAAEALRDLDVATLMTRDVITVPPELTVGELKQVMLRTHHVGFPVGNGHVQGMVTLQQVQDAPPHARVEEFMNPEPATIPLHTSALDALGKLGDEGTGRLIVTDEHGKMIGIITRTDLIHALNIRHSHAA